MKKIFLDLTAGLFSGIVLTFIPSLFSGLYGFWGIDFILRFLPSLNKSFLLLSLGVLTLYWLVSVPLFILYSSSAFFKKTHQTEGKFHRGPLLLFLVGVMVAILFYFLFGLLGFSQGEFSI